MMAGDYTSDTLTILVIEDTAVNRTLLAQTLSVEGYRVITADCGPVGRQLALEHRPHLILLDIMMPGEDGFEVIQKLKADGRTASIPVIFQTAMNDMQTKLKGFELGAVDYIVKPFNPMEIRARVRLHLRLSLATHALIASQAERLQQLHEAQTALLITPEELPTAQFSTYYASLQEAGGDFYDVVRISDHIFGYLVADVSGHDIRTSFLTAALKALMQQNCVPIYHPQDTLRMINSVLLRILPSGKYLTACYARLNRQKNMMSILSAGHPPPLYIPQDGPARLLEVQGDILGAFDDVSHDQHDLKVKAGDRFFLYSDGLIEQPEQQQLWTQGSAALLDVSEQLRRAEMRTAAAQLAQLMGTQTDCPADDVVVLGIEV